MGSDKRMERTKRYIKEHKAMFIIYLVLRLLVIGVMIAQIFNRNYSNVLMCVLTLTLFMIPSFVERRLKIDLPNTLEVIILLFIFAAEVLGEIQEYYVSVPYWDAMLHTVNGFLCAAIGIALIDILNRSDRFSFNMSPIFVALVAFCFSMTVGVVWEFYEFSADRLVRTDMQKDTVVSEISSVNFEPEGHNIPIRVDNIEKTVIYGEIDGEKREIVIDGYLDIGIIDTMKDLMVNFIGAVVFSIIGYFYIKGRGKSKFAKRFIPTKIHDSPMLPEASPEDGADDMAAPAKSE